MVFPRKKRKSPALILSAMRNISLRIFELVTVISIMNIINLGLVQSVQVKAYSAPL